MNIETYVRLQQRSMFELKASIDNLGYGYEARVYRTKMTAQTHEDRIKARALKVEPANIKQPVEVEAPRGTRLMTTQEAGNRKHN